MTLTAKQQYAHDVATNQFMLAMCISANLMLVERGMLNEAKASLDSISTMLKTNHRTYCEYKE